MTNGEDDQKKSNEKLQGIGQESKTEPKMESKRTSKPTAEEAHKQPEMEALEKSRPEII